MFLRLVLILTIAVVVVSADKTVILITGCSTGIGKATAEYLAKDPNNIVWATMRDLEKNTLPASQENLNFGQLDVTSDESVEHLIQEILAKEGKIDVVINNAGFGLAGSLEVVKIDEAKDLFDVNVWGVVRVLHAVLPSMRSRKSGYIINISSTSGIRGIPCMEYYTGSKFALEGITDSMRYSLAPYNIFVTNVNAGPVKTPFVERFGYSEVGGRGSRIFPKDKFLQDFTNRMIAGLQYRLRSPEAQSGEDIARLISNLLHMKSAATRITDVPFNIGSSLDSQRLLEEVKRNPTGWGGIYNEIMKNIPSLPADEDSKQEL